MQRRVCFVRSGCTATAQRACCRSHCWALRLHRLGCARNRRAHGAACCSALQFAQLPTRHLQFGLGCIPAGSLTACCRFMRCSQCPQVLRACSAACCGAAMTTGCSTCRGARRWTGCSCCCLQPRRLAAPGICWRRNLPVRSVPAWPRCGSFCCAGCCRLRWRRMHHTGGAQRAHCRRLRCCWRWVQWSCSAGWQPPAGRGLRCWCRCCAWPQSASLRKVTFSNGAPTITCTWRLARVTCSWRSASSCWMRKCM